MKSKRKQIIFTLILCTAILNSSLLSGCSQKSENQNTDENQESDKQTNVETVSNELRLEPNLPKNIDFEGYEFSVLTLGDFNPHWSSRDIYAEAQNGDPINDAVYARNNKIQEQYNFKIVEHGEFKNPEEAIKNAVLADEDTYDLLLLSPISDVRLAGQKMLVDLYDVPNMDLTNPWYDQNSVNELSINHKLYMVYGELHIMGKDAVWAVMFNKQLAENMKLDNLYQKVKDGKWTMDLMLEYASEASVDLNGDGVHDEFDQWGLEGEAFNSAGFIIGAGQRFSQKDENDIPFLTVQSENFYNAFEKVQQLNGNFDICLFAGNYTDKYGNSIWSDCMDKCFSEGRALFNYTGINRITLFRNMETDFGILPSPKYDEQQESYCQVISSGNCISIPITNRNLNRTGIIVEALSAESMYTLTPAYYDITLKTKASRDEESADMLDIIFQNVVYDLCRFYDWGSMYSLPGTLTGRKKANIASSIEKNISKSHAALEETIAIFTEE